MSQQSRIDERLHQEARAARCRDQGIKERAARQAAARRAVEDQIEQKRLREELEWLD